MTLLFETVIVVQYQQHHHDAAKMQLRRQQPQQPQPLQPAHHKQLYGRERLFNVIKCLSISCPWTKSITPPTMLTFLESELKELRHELDILSKAKKEAAANNDDQVISSNNDGGDNDNNSDSKVTLQTNKEALISEVGDIIFDVLDKCK